MIVIVSGSRHLTDRTPIERALGPLTGDVVLFHGGANGADTLAGHYARIRGWEVVVVPADFRTYGPDDGPMRNAEMLIKAKRRAIREKRRVHLFAFPAPDSRGTRNAIALARLLKVPTTVLEVTL